MARRTAHERIRTVMVVTVVAACAIGAAQAQHGPTHEAAFDSISVMRASTPPRVVRRSLPSYWSVTLDAGVHDLIRRAYAPDGIHARQQIVDVPDAITRERFDIVVVPTPGVLFTRHAPLHPSAWRAVLAERFGLRAHVERRMLPVYDLVVAAEAAGQSRISPSACVGAQAGLPPLGRHCGAGRLAGGGSAEGVTMLDLANALSALPEVGHLVRDQTGLGGPFDIQLRWSGGLLIGRGTGLVRLSRPVNALELPTALHSQLGLRLERREAEVAVLVVDGITLPPGL